MKKPNRQELPRGWTPKKVRELIAYYDNQSEEEGAAEIESAPEAPGEIWMSVPTELVPAVARLIEDQELKASDRRPQRNKSSRARPNKIKHVARR